MSFPQKQTFTEQLCLYCFFLGVFFWTFGSISFFLSKDAFKSFQYGWFFLPALVCLILGRLDLTNFEKRIEFITEARCNSLSINLFLILSFIHALATNLKHLSFQTHMDLAIYANACKNYLFSTMKGDVWLLADHFEPSLIFFSPLCQLWDPALTLLTAQTCIWGLGSYGVYRFAQTVGFNITRSFLFGFIYLQASVTTIPAYYDFHLITLSLGFLPWLFYLIQTERWLYFWIIALCYLGLKENTSLTLAFLGISMFFSPKKSVRLHGSLLFILSFLAFAAIMQIVFPSFRNGQPSMYFQKYYSHLGGNLWEVCLAPLKDPVGFVKSFLTTRKIGYFFALFTPFLFLPLFDWRKSLVLIPAFFINLASNDTNITARIWHYEAELYPLLFLLTMIVLSTRGGKIKFKGATTVWMLFILTFWGGKSLAWGVARWWPNQKLIYLHKQLLSQTSDLEKKLSAPQKIAAHLTRTPKLYMMDYIGSENDWKKADRIVVAYPYESMGYFSALEIEKDFVGQFFQGYDLIYQDTKDKTFRIWERKKEPFMPALQPK